MHLGVTEAGDGDDGRIKSALGIGSLLEDGIGDTIRVSLTEDPEFEVPVAQKLAARYNNRASHADIDFTLSQDEIQKHGIHLNTQNFTQQKLEILEAVMFPELLPTIVLLKTYNPKR